MLCLVTDLIFSTQITSTASSLGVQVKVVRTLEKLRERLETGIDRAALIDLNADGVDVIDAIQLCRQSPHRPRIIAYVSHVRADLIQAARSAGADEVMARSAFVEKLPAILTADKNDPGAQPQPS